ncbi:protein PHYTOCHROME KINASE SUBSTRATE 3-like [Lycium barbarum]|uniref:protein PHYTOCHROME KINASE SUBSTRATE 3-like n=1 Tax=Lycium barbarum TaxID=112863 RepID=UPI00293EDE57|nr:protein PHYTOCHROME KINASE SUBSTRATE 3-like [Lycium barbarum]
METDDNATSRVASFSCYLSNPEDQSFIHKLGGTYDELYPTKAPTIKASSNNTQDNLANLCVESLSTYLKAEGDNFAFKTSGAAPVQDPTIAFVFPQQALAGSQKHHERTKSKDGELSIFGADKYFNMKLEYGAGIPTTGVKYGGQTNKGTVNLPHVKPSSRTGTPSICSEASSFNSQSALLQNLPRNRKQNKMTGRRFFASFGCQGPCSGKKAVYVDKTLERGLSQPGSKHSAGNFALSSGTPSVNEKLRVVKKHSDDQDPIIGEPRKSIEVFGSSKMRKGDIAVNLERKLSMLTWDAIPKAAQNITTTTIGSSIVCDDMASDASSDLFEIENISTCGYGHNMNSKTSDYVPGCMSPTTTQYAPSEASIEWSVITASAADYSSVISDYDAKRISNNGHAKNTKTKNAVGKEDQKTPRPGGLLGCKSHKAVSVVETVYKTSEKTKHHQRG